MTQTVFIILFDCPSFLSTSLSASLDLFFALIWINIMNFALFPYFRFIDLFYIMLVLSVLLFDFLLTLKSASKHLSIYAISLCCADGNYMEYIEILFSYPHLCCLLESPSLTQWAFNRFHRCAQNYIAWNKIWFETENLMTDIENNVSHNNNNDIFIVLLLHIILYKSEIRKTSFPRKPRLFFWLNRIHKINKHFIFNIKKIRNQNRIKYLSRVIHLDGISIYIYHRYRMITWIYYTPWLVNSEDWKWP